VRFDVLSIQVAGEGGGGMNKRQALVNELKGAVTANLVAARAYRRMEHVPGLTYVGTDRKFADAMWFGCMQNVRSSMNVLRVITRAVTL